MELEATWHRENTKDHAIVITVKKTVGVVRLCGFPYARNTGIPSLGTV